MNYLIQRERVVYVQMPDVRKKQRESTQNAGKRPPRAPSTIIYHPQLFLYLLEKHLSDFLDIQSVKLVPYNRRDIISAIGRSAELKVAFCSRIRDARDLLIVTHDPHALHTHDHML